MAKPTTPRSTPTTTARSDEHMGAIHALGHPHSPPPRTRWARPGSGPGGEPAVAANSVAGFVPNIPAAPSLIQGAGSSLIANWMAPPIDGTHGAATGYVLRSSPSGAGAWTAVSPVVSPYGLTGLPAGTAIDVQIQAVNAVGASGWSASATLSTAVAGPYAPNSPAAPALAQGTGSDLLVTWSAHAVDGTHNAATSYALRSSPSGAGSWTVVPGVSSPYGLSGLAGGAAIDVQVQAANAGGSGAWSATSTLTTASAGPSAPNAPAITSVRPPPDGTNSKLVVVWSAPAVDGGHDAATGYNLRFSPGGAGTWTVVSGATSPYTLTGLAGASAIDVEVQARNAGGTGAWSAISTGTTWGTTVVWGNWTAALSQPVNTPVAPNGGVQMTAAPAPTAVTGASFAWSTGNTVMPTSGLIVAGADGQTNGWGQWFSSPATAGTYYLWCLPQGAGGVTIGALVSAAITVG